MKQGVSVITLFVLGIPQFIIGVFLIADKANLHTIGWYYIFASSFTVFVSLLAAVGISINKEDK